MVNVGLAGVSECGLASVCSGTPALYSVERSKNNGIRDQVPMWGERERYRIKTHGIKMTSLIYIQDLGIALAPSFEPLQGSTRFVGSPQKFRSDQGQTDIA